MESVCVLGKLLAQLVIFFLPPLLLLQLQLTLLHSHLHKETSKMSCTQNILRLEYVSQVI